MLVANSSLEGNFSLLVTVIQKTDSFLFGRADIGIADFIERDEVIVVAVYIGIGTAETELVFAHTVFENSLRRQ